jgi:hypothetical protein
MDQKRGSIWNHLFSALPASLVFGIKIKKITFWNIAFRPQAKLETPTELGPIEKEIINSWAFCP